MLPDKTQNTAPHLRLLPLISVIVPVHNRLSELEECLDSLHCWRTEGCELILVDDHSTGDVREIADRHGARYFRTPRREGPAGARNLGVHHAIGEILVFVDADVVLSPNTLSIIRGEFDRSPGLAGLFGSYDDEPRCAGFFSSFKNLFHHHTHQAARPEAVTFWSGCGAIRKSVFETVGGFNAARYPVASIEDIELGLRLRQQGQELRLVKSLQVKHLKEWTLTSLMRTDIFQRAIPWTKLILRTGYIPRDLNLAWASRVSAALVAAMALLAVGLFVDLLGFLKWSSKDFAVALLIAAAILLVVNAGLYRFFRRKRGARFAIAAIAAHWAYLFYSGTAFLFACVAEVFPVSSRPPCTESEPSDLVPTRLDERQTPPL